MVTEKKQKKAVKQKKVDATEKKKKDQAKPEKEAKKKEGENKLRMRRKEISRKKKKRTVEAVDLVRSKAISLNEASRSFGIPLSTLGDKVRRRRSIKARSKFLLTNEEEAYLVDWGILYAECLLGRTGDDLKNEVKEILELRGDEGRRGDDLPGKDWVLSLWKRHPELSIRTP
ncbi:tigger transposable element-derived protein 6-like protein [Elysia marginata]|uniref:Tigger transposable element-derived protein 6-like protein n=1 Tax=Elysia marginata TaxID=1093978 RepID=A0AAV4HZM0_9GAST|nr:tigger transposable element-derived protein 6-like protein [Elysia marginata]